MRWHELTWNRIDALDRGTPVVIPLGSIEQHGHHLPLAVDTLQVEAIADRLERRLGAKALFLPVQWLGSSHHHIDFAGTISLRPSLYGQLIQEVARCVLRHRFSRLLFLNGHGGNEAPATAALSELVGTDDAADGACIAFTSWWKAGRDALKPECHGMTTPSISHACEYETSLLMALRPDLVDVAAIVDPPPPPGDRWVDPAYGGKVTVFRRWHRLTAVGGMGRPSAATEAKGRSLLDGVVDELSAMIGDFAAWPRLPVLARNRDAHGASQPNVCPSG